MSSAKSKTVKVSSKRTKSPKKKTKSVEYDEPQPDVDSAPTNVVTVTVGTISKIQRLGPAVLQVVATFMRETINTSPNYDINIDDDEINLNYCFTLPCTKMNSSYWKTLCGNQILLEFKLLDRGTKENVDKIKNAKSRNKNTKKTGSTSKSISSFHSTKTNKSKSINKKEKKTPKSEKCNRFMDDSPILGSCSIDLLPILEGQPDLQHEVNGREYKTTLKVQQPYVEIGQDMVTYENLPEVEIKIITEQDIPLQDGYNILSITIESVYNIDPDMMMFRAAVLLPKPDPLPLQPDKEEKEKDKNDPILEKNLTEKVKENKTRKKVIKSKKKSKGNKSSKHSETLSIGKTKPPPPDKPIPFIFNYGTRTLESNHLNKKKWESFTERVSRAALSSYDLVKTIYDIQNPLNLDLKNIYGEYSRIEWNCIYRHWMQKDEIEPLIGNLKKNRYPIEFMETSSKRPFHAMAMPDLRAMLWPGVTRLRVACPLYAYNSELMKSYCNLLYPLLEENLKGKGKEKKTLKKKSKVSSKKSSKNSKRGNTSSKHSETPSTIPPLTPLLNYEGKPMFAIVQLQIKNPLVLHRTLEELEKDIDQLIPHREKLPKVVMDVKTAENNFREAIYGSLDKIIKEYNSYAKIQLYKTNTSNVTFSDYMFQIVQHLKLTGTYQHIKSLLVQRVAHLINQKFLVGTSLETENDYEMMMAQVYSYISTEAHCIINTQMGIQREVNDKCHIKDTSSSDLLWKFAKEAEAIGDIERAKTLLLQRIEINKKNPDIWFDYAVFLAAQKEVNKAIVCTLEALDLDSKHRLSLLLHAILRLRQDAPCYVDSETLLLGLTSFYPLFTEGWVALYLMYLKVDDDIGEAATLQYGLECHGNKESYSLPTEMENRDYFCWSWTPEDDDDMFIQAAAFFLKLNIYEFAELSLAEYIKYGGDKNDKYYYLLAVHHYLQNRYSDAIPHLESAIKIRGEDQQLCSLLGHCYYFNGESVGAQKYYEYVVHSPDRPLNISLVYYNFGQLLHFQDELVKAKTVYLNSCKYFSSPANWLGVGITSYKLRDFVTAEKAIQEATNLDRHFARAWGYLALVNLSLVRYNEFVQCYRIAKKTNLKDPCILQEIDLVRRQKNLPDPGCLCFNANA